MIIVEITVPSLDGKFDFQLDETVPVAQLRGEICEILCKKSGSVMPEHSEEFLFASLEQNKVIDQNLSLSENGISEGSHLVLL